MQKFVDRHGHVWIVDIDIDSTTLRRVKTLTGVRLLDAVDGDLIPQMTQDFLLLGEVLFAVCKSQADKDSINQEAFESRLSGDCLNKAHNSLVEALLDSLP